MLRILILAATAISGGVALGRKAIDRSIDRRVSAEIETAQARAIAELDRKATTVIREQLTAFARSLAIKVVLLGSAYALYATDYLALEGFRFIVLLFIGAFIVRDSASVLPYLVPAIRLARRHSWSPKRTLTALVAGVVFERAYADTLVAAQTRTNKVWIALSNYSAESLSQNVADAVSQVASETSYDRIRPRALLALGLAAVMGLSYWAFIALTLGSA